MLVSKEGGSAPDTSAASYVGDEEGVSSSGIHISNFAAMVSPDGLIGKEDTSSPLRSAAFSLTNQMVAGSVQYRGYQQGSG